MLSEQTSGWARSGAARRSCSVIPWPPPVVMLITASQDCLIRGRNCMKTLGSGVGLPSRPIGDAVMAGLGLQVMLFLGRREAGAEGERRRGLADGADVVVLAFDREQRGALDRRRLDRAVARHERAERQRMLLEHPLDR